MPRPKKQVDYEALLKSEGLGALDWEDPDGRVRVLPALSPEGAAQVERAQAVAAYLRWANDVLATCAFRTKREETAWRMMAEGKPRSEIATALKVSQDAVRRLLNSVIARVSPSPVPNPWHRGGTPSNWTPHEETIAELVSACPETAADMITTATTYISELGDDCMSEYRDRLERDMFGTVPDHDMDNYLDGDDDRDMELPRFPNDGVPSAALCGPVKVLSRTEIAQLSYTPPKKIGN